MAARRRETSAESAERFLASRERASALYKRPRPYRSRVPMPVPSPPRRITVDFAESTLRLIHEVLLEAILAGVDFGERSALLPIAEQMVAGALGAPPWFDPPLTDREVG